MSHLPDDLAAWERAAYETVHAHVGRGGRRGSVALAPVLNLAPRSISNMVNPEMNNAKLGVRDAIAIMAATGDYRLLQAIALDCQHVCWQVPDPGEVVDDIELLERLTAWQSAIGETMAEIHRAFADRRIEAHEVRALVERLHVQMRRGLEFCERFKAVQEPEQRRDAARPASCGRPMTQAKRRRPARSFKAGRSSTTHALESAGLVTSPSARAPGDAPYSGQVCATAIHTRCGTPTPR